MGSGNSSFAGKLLKGAYLRVKSIGKNPFSQTGLSWWDVKEVKHLKEQGHYTKKIFDRPVQFNSPHEFLHSIDEIFIKEIYKIDLPKNPFILDCGANLGFSVIYFKRKYPDAELIAFEPDEYNFPLLQKNINSFHFEGVELRKEAVWKENTTLNFSSEGSMASRIDDSGENGSGNGRVKAVRLRDFLSRKVDLLKIDIEGAEYEVLKDIQDRLNMVDNLFFEYHGTFQQAPELIDSLKILNEAGFSFYIREATEVYKTPFSRDKSSLMHYDIQLNVYCFRT